MLHNITFIYVLDSSFVWRNDLLSILNTIRNGYRKLIFCADTKAPSHDNNQFLDRKS